MTFIEIKNKIKSFLSSLILTKEQHKRLISRANRRTIYWSKEQLNVFSDYTEDIEFFPSVFFFERKVDKVLKDPKFRLYCILNGIEVPK